ncbi:unnamed protein product [Ostreobium quekettii]|uniref:EVE domain-containing protein n=1 Tax=Ostreobium quekettii TaxID=121088 RepID=A0A8S1J6E2_9CHLO|nr:unnamed protein product [Ostreobium quekettii]|eukprot:evm.model.scf_2411.3 EVM.evm.TU.scf_2411.3   scf_2411:10602-10985(+)
MQSCTVGDKVLFYHSCCKPPGVVGLATVCREAYPDYTCWDAKHSAYDPKSTEAKPRWTMVDIQFVRKLKRLISLDELKQHKDGALKDLALFKTSRLSVQPVSADEYDFIVGLENVTEGEKKVNGDEK